MLSCLTALNTMLELSYAIRNPGEYRASAVDFLSPLLLPEDLTHSPPSSFASLQWFL